MNWDAIGAIGEVVGAIAVVLTLLYLSVQLRQAAKSNQSANLANIRAGAHDFVVEIAKDKELLDLYIRTLSGAEISKEEQIRIDLMFVLLFRAVENAFIEEHRGELDREMWDSTEAHFTWVLSHPGAIASWKRQRRFLTKSFRNYFDLVLEKKVVS